jgi:hypothetical protein
LAAAGIRSATGVLGTVRILGGGERLIHNAADSSGASSTLGAAAQAAIHLASRTWRYGVASERSADVVIAQHVTGTDNHSSPERIGTNCNYLYLVRAKVDFNQNRTSLERF